ncbi:MAG: alpha/beta fold hydrolase [Microbacteriaceae bacterium]
MSIDGTAVIWSAPAAERADRPLIVLLHGYGSHEGDLFQLAPLLPLGPAVASLRAPLTAGAGFAWFPLAGLHHVEPAAVTAAASSVLAWLDTVPGGPVALLGFSQGAAVALQAMRLAPHRLAAVVALSGFAAGGLEPGDAELAAASVPVFWGRGDDDGVIPEEAIEHTARWLPAHAALTTRVYPGLTHAVCAPEIADVAAFLREHLR